MQMLVKKGMKRRVLYIAYIYSYEHNAYKNDYNENENYKHSMLLDLKNVYRWAICLPIN